MARAVRNCRAFLDFGRAPPGNVPRSSVGSSGLIFFTLDFAWVGHTVGRYIGVVRPVHRIRPRVDRSAVLRARRRAGVCSRTRERPEFAPLGAAAAFTLLRMDSFDRHLRCALRSARLHASGWPAARDRGVCRHVRHHVRALRDRSVRRRRAAPADVAAVYRRDRRASLRRRSRLGSRGPRARCRRRRFRSRPFKATSRSRSNGRRARWASRFIAIRP